jgi:putative ABC transport system permease protein
MISSILMAFVSISLIVSSIMIGIITYVSVLERTKEIGILKSIGASKKDISRVFNAETLIIGLSSGLLGVVISWLLTIPGNIIIEDVSGATNIAALPFWGAVGLVALSMCLTLIAGLIPSRLAAKKDPVVALRTE